MWASAHHGNQPVQQQHVPKYSVQHVQSTDTKAFNADITLNIDLGADMPKVRKLKTSPWMALIKLSAVA
ncbi:MULTISPECIES: hypothetical protein [unclassified Caballeronia]|uniref:hypothetical protein n=1 Tax=unclassified Caballeronia TaxID=2646786 RepID=UPI002027E860|nr:MULTISPECIES: hypothetical protein [unclassified Caballeronia]